MIPPGIYHQEVNLRSYHRDLQPTAKEKSQNDSAIGLSNAGLFGGFSSVGSKKTDSEMDTESLCDFRGH